jgi:hypothetical protein
VSTLDEVGAYLAANGFGTLAREIWLGRRPESPNSVITLIEYPGNGPTLVQEGMVGDNPMLQLTVRDTVYEAAADLAYRIWRFLALKTNVMLGSTRYLSLRPTASPALMGRDSSNRVLLGFNVAIMKEVS